MLHVRLTHNLSQIHGKEKHIVEINFLCVHKKMRSKRVAPVLIREITRRVNATGIFQAVYTAGVVLPKPIATCRYCVFFIGTPFIFLVLYTTLFKFGGPTLPIGRL